MFSGSQAVVGLLLSATSHDLPAQRVSSAVKLPPFQKLLDAHAVDVHRFLIALVGPHDADDCYQETWLAALRAYPQLRDAANLRGWVLTIARRKAIDHVRRRRAVTPVAEVPDQSAAPFSTADDELWTHVRELPAKQRRAVALRYFADAGYGEISAVMGTSEEAARRNVHEGLKRLRTEYQR
jgi:RNA polymerase sigma factor (sigma-70 family)